jgi:rod shape-determining protein MreC
VSAVIQSSRAQGVVAGSADGTLTMEFVEGTADVKAGDLVMTSGVGGSLPQGEVIGRVVDVSNPAQDLYQSVHVEPLADLSSLEGVLILTSFLPRVPGQP